MKAEQKEMIVNSLFAADKLAQADNTVTVFIFYWLARAAVFALCAIADAINTHD